MSKKRKPDSAGLEDVERSLFSSFCTAANSISQLYSLAQNQQRAGFHAGERHALVRMQQWLEAGAHANSVGGGGSSISKQKLLDFIQGELDGIDEGWALQTQPQGSSGPSLGGMPGGNPRFGVAAGTSPHAGFGASGLVTSQLLSQLNLGQVRPNAAAAEPTRPYNSASWDSAPPGAGGPHPSLAQSPGEMSALYAAVPRSQAFHAAAQAQGEPHSHGAAENFRGEPCGLPGGNLHRGVVDEGRRHLLDQSFPSSPLGVSPGTGGGPSHSPSSQEHAAVPSVHQEEEAAPPPSNPAGNESAVGAGIGAVQETLPFGSEQGSPSPFSDQSLGALGQRRQGLPHGGYGQRPGEGDRQKVEYCRQFSFPSKGPQGGYDAHMS